VIAVKIKAAIAGVPTRAREVEGTANFSVVQGPGPMRRNRPFVHAGSAHAYPQCVQINGDDGQCLGVPILTLGDA
jgi:hypothetical protein